MTQQPFDADCHIAQQSALISPAELHAAVPLGGPQSGRIGHKRRAIAAALHGDDPRLVIVVGPCSIHDPAAALEYAQRLAHLGTELQEDLIVVMRTYFEKPRTTVGWKGLINDPYLDETYAINDGLRLGRRLLLDILELEVPTGCEFLDAISPQYLADAVCWGAIGARTTESQVHRALASGLCMPVGFKNGTDGSIDIAIEGVISAAHPHSFLGINRDGQASIVATTGNPHCHVILRGGKRGPNYGPDSVRQVLADLQRAGLPQRLMVDVSHGNSGRDHRQQLPVARQVAQQIAAGQAGIVGVMLESFLLEGKQALGSGAPLRYGQSITDACLGWEDTETALRALAQGAAKRRRQAIGGAGVAL
jgi:3-deoxy-7-phosphoheptulonate synthase